MLRQTQTQLRPHCRQGHHHVLVDLAVVMKWSQGIILCLYVSVCVCIYLSVNLSINLSVTVCMLAWDYRDCKNIFCSDSTVDFVLLNPCHNGRPSLLCIIYHITLHYISRICNSNEYKLPALNSKQILELELIISTSKSGQLTSSLFGYLTCWIRANCKHDNFNLCPARSNKRQNLNVICYLETLCSPH